MSEIVLLLSADINLQQAYEWIESRREGLGGTFIAEVDRLLGLLATFPELGPVVYGSRRRLIVRDFNFGIFYTITGPRVFVSNILDLRADPDWIRRQLGT